MNEEEVKKQLKQMVAFIEKEAKEKANEINVKAQEEFNIEKQKLVKAEKQRLAKDFERKEKQAEIKKKIAYSNELNQSRLKVLKAREDGVQELYAAAGKALVKLSQNPDSYKKLLTNLIIQGLIRMEESEVDVICRQVDVGLVQSVLATAAAEYKKRTGRDVKLKVSNAHFLAPPPSDKTSGPSCAGGVLMSANEGRLLCNNTLEQRLALAYEAKLPEIRTMLFGKSLTRVHYD